jgi:integrase
VAVAAPNPCDRVLKPAYQSNRPNLWTRSESDIFLEATAVHPLWVLLLGTGCRLGEALALRWDNVKLGLAVTVDETMDGEWIIGKPKTAGAERTVMLPATVTDALQHQKTRQATWQEAAGPDWQENAFVFTGKTGKPLHRSAPAHALKRECEHLGLPPMTPHGLRHLHASLLLDEGVPITAVSARLGHANPQITIKFFAHSLAGQDRRAADAIGEVLTKGDDMEPRTEHTE